MMKYFFVALISIGCASHSEMKDKEPTMFFYSDNSAEKVKDCIDEIWTEEYSTSAKSIKTKNGYRVMIVNGYGGVLVLANIEEKPAGSYTTVHEHSISLLSKDTYGVIGKYCK